LLFGAGKLTIWLYYDKQHYTPCLPSAEGSKLSAARREHLKGIPENFRFTLQNIQAARGSMATIDLRGGGKSTASLTSRRTFGAASSSPASSSRKTLGASKGAASASRASTKRRTLGGDAATVSSDGAARPMLLGFDPNEPTTRQNSKQRALLARRLATTTDWLCSPEPVAKRKISKEPGWRCTKCGRESAQLCGLLRNHHTSCGKAAGREPAARRRPSKQSFIGMPSYEERKQFLVEHNLITIQQDTQRTKKAQGVDFKCTICDLTIAAAGKVKNQFTHEVYNHLKLHGTSARELRLHAYAPMKEDREAVLKTWAETRRRREELWKEHAPSEACKLVFKNSGIVSGFNVHRYECTECKSVGTFYQRTRATCSAAGASAECREAAKERIQEAKAAVECIIQEERAARKKARLREMSMAGARTIFY
jgi:hypothetical protein